MTNRRKKLVAKLTYRLSDDGDRADIFTADGKRIAYCHPRTAQLIREREDIRPFLGLVKLY